MQNSLTSNSRIKYFFFKTLNFPQENDKVSQLQHQVQKLREVYEEEKEKNDLIKGQLQLAEINLKEFQIKVKQLALKKPTKEKDTYLQISQEISSNKSGNIQYQNLKQLDFQCIQFLNLNQSKYCNESSSLLSEPCQKKQDDKISKKILDFSRSEKSQKQQKSISQEGNIDENMCLIQKKEILNNSKEIFLLPQQLLEQQRKQKQNSFEGIEKNENTKEDQEKEQHPFLPQIEEINHQRIHEYFDDQPNLSIDQVCEKKQEEQEYKENQQQEEKLQNQQNPSSTMISEPQISSNKNTIPPPTLPVIPENFQPTVDQLLDSENVKALKRRWMRSIPKCEGQDFKKSKVKYTPREFIEKFKTKNKFQNVLLEKKTEILHSKALLNRQSTNKKLRLS